MRVWLKPIVPQDKLDQQLQDKNNVLKGGASGVGIKLIRNNIQMSQMKNSKEIDSAFSDLQSLKQKSKGMV